MTGDLVAPTPQASAGGPTAELPASAAPSTPVPVLSPTRTGPPPSTSAVGRSLATVPAPPAVDRPVRVTVDDVGIDATVDPVGVAADGQMALPPDPDVLGWYEFGPAPGAATGSVVLGGHLDTVTHGVGQLVRLRDVQVGASVVVASASGTERRYRVTDVQRIAKAGLPVEELFRRTGAPALVLVTCGGEYRAELGGYQENLVVTAVPA